MPGDHPALDYALLTRKQLLKRNAALLNRLLRDYMLAYKSLQAEIDALLEAIALGTPELWQLQQLAAFYNLMDGIRSEMNAFGQTMGSQLNAEILAEIQQANLNALGMVQASLPGMDPALLTATWTVLSPEQVYMMYGFLAPQGPLYSSFALNFGTAVANLIRDTMMTGYISGMNPRTIAALINKAVGTGLNWAMNTARTAQLWAYRSASHLNYLNNSQVVKSWTWFAQLDPRVCMSCISQHGSEHPLTETLADHHMGRCTAIPNTYSYAELGVPGIDENPLKVQRGEDWFKKLPVSVPPGSKLPSQKGLMGPAKYYAWKDGMFQFNQLSVPYNDPIYGRMLREASLKGLIGDKANLYYGKR